MADSQETYYVITANHLVDGDVVYMIQDGDNTKWITDIANADTYTTENRGNAIIRAEESAKANVIIGAYAIEITGKNEPLGTKETIRSSGPTVPHGRDAMPSVNPDYSI